MIKVHSEPIEAYLKDYTVVQRLGDKWTSPILLNKIDAATKTVQYRVLKPIFNDASNEVVTHSTLYNQCPNHIIKILDLVKLNTLKLRKWIWSTQYSSIMDYDSWLYEVAVLYQDVKTHPLVRPPSDTKTLPATASHETQCILMDYACGGTMWSAINVYPQYMISMLAQCLLITSFVRSHYPNWRHNDFHASNLLLIPTTDTHINITVNIQGVQSKLSIPTHGYKLVLSDFEWSQLDDTKDKLKTLKPTDVIISSEYFDIYRLVESCCQVKKIAPDLLEELQLLTYFGDTKHSIDQNGNYFHIEAFSTSDQLLAFHKLFNEFRII